MNIKRDYYYHPPTQDSDVEAHRLVRVAFIHLAECMNGLLPDNAEKIEMDKKLQQAMFYSNASLARSRLYEQARLSVSRQEKP